MWTKTGQSYSIDIIKAINFNWNNFSNSVCETKAFEQSCIMADESLQLPTNQNLDYHIITLFQRLETMRKDSNINRIGGRLSSMKSKYNMQAEIRSLEFWRYFEYFMIIHNNTQSAYLLIVLDTNYVDCSNTNFWHC